MNMIELLLDNGYEPSYGVLIEDRDTDTTSYWFDLTFETTARDQELGIQTVTVAVTTQVYDMYERVLGLQKNIRRIVQQPELEQIESVRYETF